ncbi:MAG: zinc-binding dehydrogenase [FCB group bacterium]|nr:zinc-binding dehydrogenase [FCB group bacterium]
MKAVRIHEHGGPEVLRVDEVPKPVCPEDKVLVQIKAAALNHLDLWIRNGIPGMHLDLPLILGSDGAGVISEIGKSVTGWGVGDRVVIQPNRFCGNCEQCLAGRENYCRKFGIIGETESGVQCEYYIADTANIHPMADHLSFPEAASMQLVFLTAHQMLVKRAGLKRGETVLIYGGTSGVGSAAIQIAKDLGGRVLATVGSEEKRTFALDLGADHVFIHSENRWSRQVKELVGRKGIDVIFEHPGAATWPQSLRLLGRGGRIVTCGATTGPGVNLDLRHLFMKQQSILGSTMSDLDTFRKVMEKIHAKIYKPFVDKIFPLEAVGEAHERIENREQMGKVVLVL